MICHPRLVIVVLTACALAAVPGVADAGKAPAYPSVTRVSPLKLGVGDVLTVRGKGFRAGHARTTVVFKRDGGRAIFVKADKATKTSLTVVIPGKMVNSLTRTSGAPAATRFRVRVLAAKFGRRYTAAKGSPTIGPKAVTSKVAGDDCDGDRIKNSVDTDDDNDLLPDTLEATLATDPCKRDTDGDGMSDGWEYESALDYNGRAKPSPNKRPYPNALDPADAQIDSDGDGMTNAQEYAAWATFGANKLPLNYSGGDPATGGKRAPAAGGEWVDRDANRILSDNERDADGDGIPNQEEDLIDGFPDTGTVDGSPRPVGSFSKHHIDLVHDAINVVPLYGPLKHTQKVSTLNWLDSDSDGDTIKDGDDDNDGDGLSNLSELRAEITSTDPVRELPINACAPNPDARLCLVGDDDIDHDGMPNRVDDDDDGDLLPDGLELTLGLNPYDADSDGDGVGDGYEYYSAKDLNGAAVPYPSKQSYPNPLDKDDANVDHDGDGLTLLQEFRAWKFTGAPLPLSYSDGTQHSLGTAATDDDKDVDGDGLDNYTESSGPLSGPGWYDEFVADNKCSQRYVETPYPAPKYAGLNFVDPDSDGDGIPDGADDIDHDGLSNAFEGRPRDTDWCTTYQSVGPDLFGQPGVSSGHAGTPGDTGKYARINPFNPCKPVASQACHSHPPFGYYVYTSDYTEDWIGPQP